MRRVARHLLDAEVPVGEARDLRQVRDRDHLRALGEPAERAADGVRGLTADAGVEVLNGWIGLVLYLVISPAFFAYVQSGLNSVWKTQATR